MENFKQIVVLQFSQKHKIINFTLGLLLFCFFVFCYINLEKESSIVYKTIDIFLIIYTVYFLINSFVKKIIITEVCIKEKNLFYSKSIFFDKIVGLTKYNNYGLIVKKRFNNIKISHEYDFDKRVIAIDYVLSKTSVEHS
ncbi:hypothetical protein QWY99_05035 [Flavobacterium branchiarum]|uniref:DUF304 domain-containing protein n=1 Tax=Flavobacterium branchiarum TaxID=1114870 RepID=A0ABV5FK36_9FLAO|nr:hypothetical protein [Flavobacterium branchiarum]MDN3672420.1 hypothetical protein [Flavobacterium branchiarum]